MSSGEQFAPEALEAWPCGLALARLDGTLLACNRYFEELVGRTSEEMTGTTRFSELLTVPGKLFYDTHFLPQLRLQGRIHEIAFDLARKGQPAIPTLLNAVIRKTADGASETVCYAVFKASERRRYERELLLARRNAEYLTELFKFSDDAIMTVSPDDVITNWNESATRLFGYAPSEVMGRKLPELIVPDDLQQEFRRMREKLGDGTTQRLETVRVSRDGTRIDVSTTLTPHLEPPGIMVGYSCVIRDETERKKTAQALIRSEKIASVGRLASSIAHEINNPLEAVTNLLYIMEGDPTLEAQTRNYLEMAQKELSRVSHVAMHTLRFHRQSTRATPTEMGPLLDSVLALYESRLRNVQITVERQYSAAPLIHVFESEVRQVFANLIANAADALQGAEQRIVVLRVRPSHDWRTRKAGVTVSVADTGCGISEEAKRHLFEAFYSTKGIGGTGLGLWVSKEIIERHGGKFHVRSREGVGTVFSVFLPSTNAPSVT